MIPTSREYGAAPTPFVLSLSKHRSSFTQQEKQPFDKLRANGASLGSRVVSWELQA